MTDRSMSAATHTPGPWFVGNNDRPADGDDDGLRGTDIYARIPDGGYFRGTVATLYAAPHIGGITVEERDANARLIAAAPELLAALQGAIGALEFSRDYHNDLSNAEQAFAQDKLDAAQAAIAKATGAA